MLDNYPNLFLGRGEMEFREALYHIRNTIFCYQLEWDFREKSFTVQSPRVSRILVCGNAGIGKSTLINKVFGSDVVSRTQSLLSAKSVTNN